MTVRALFSMGVNVLGGIYIVINNFRTNNNGSYIRINMSKEVGGKYANKTNESYVVEIYE